MPFAAVVARLKPVGILGLSVNVPPMSGAKDHDVAAFEVEYYPLVSNPKPVSTENWVRHLPGILQRSLCVPFQSFPDPLSGLCVQFGDILCSSCCVNELVLHFLGTFPNTCS